MNKNVLVIGERCVDVFVYGITTRKSPEGDGLVFTPIDENVRLGMAQNLKFHLSFMGFAPKIVTCENKIKKIRYVNINTRHLYLRVDENDSIRRINIEKIDDLEKYDAIAISDYCKGFLLPSDIEFISKRNPNCFLDTKKELGDWCKDLKYIKINEAEYNKNGYFISKNDWIYKKIVKTLGVMGAEYNAEHFPTTAIKNADISGAGDVFFASFINEILIGNNVRKSIINSNQYTYNYLINKKI